MRLSVSFHPVCHDKPIANHPESSCSWCCCTEARIPFGAHQSSAGEARPRVLGANIHPSACRTNALLLGEVAQHEKKNTLCKIAVSHTSPFSSLRCVSGQMAAHTARCTGPRWGRSRGVNADCPRGAVCAKPEAGDIYQALTGKVDGEPVAGGFIFFFSFVLQAC